MSHSKKKKKLADQIEALKSNSEDSDTSPSDSTGYSTPSCNARDQNGDPEQFKMILGENPADENLFCSAISGDIATRWKTYLSQGIDKEVKTKLMEKWRIPLNYKNLQAPQLNPEDLQDMLGQGLTALACTLDSLMSKKDQPTHQETPNLTDLAEAGKLLCHVHYTISNHTRFQINSHFNIQVQKIATTKKTNNFLFREDFAEKCKNIKSFKTTTKQLQASSSMSKNHRGPAAKARWKGVPKMHNYKPKVTKSYRKREEGMDWRSHQKEWKKNWYKKIYYDLLNYYITYFKLSCQCLKS
ncbi:hypothetical protein ABEB36_014919 [Hypothenemus hampei]|uniref:Uncharacterized protein n=1 Tax=Hypothenemus hampei TaxID=57062 RepID=A0ABD1E1A7_HYPHA